MNAAAPDLHRGTYPLADAARLARMPRQTVRRWVEGYDWRHRGEPRCSEGVAYLRPAATAAAQNPRDRSLAPVLDFEQLLTLLLVRAFHERGLSLRKIKAAAARAKARYDLENPFVSKHFESDGNTVFIGLDPAALGRERQILAEQLSREVQDERWIGEAAFASLCRWIHGCDAAFILHCS